MRRILILVLCFLIGYSNSMALPGRFSAECSPTYAINRVDSPMQPPLYTKRGAMKLHFGGAYHFPLQEYTSLSVGIAYALGHIALARKDSESVHCDTSYDYDLHYVWLPCLCRFYTSEVMIDTSIYVKLGLIPSISLPPRSTSYSSNPTFLTRSLGCFILLGGGVKYDFSLTNSFVVGLSYCWDVAGVMYTKKSHNGSTYAYNNFVCFDLCCLF